MEKNKRNKIIGLTLGILVVLIIVVSSTYAYWQITKTQETPNDIVAACLSLALNDASEENKGIDLDSAWPISDEEAQNLTGYTFTVTNNCNEEINYIVGLNRVEEETANYLLDSSIKLQLDDNSTFLYSDLSDVEYADAENTEYTARSSKQVSVETIGTSATNTHTFRVWVSEDAPVTEQSKTFLGQVFITGGQGIEVPECFTIAENGTITGYNYECGTEVVVPAEINGIQVKAISNSSFAQGNIVMYYLYNETTEEEKQIMYYTDEDTVDDFIGLAKQMMCEDPTTCTVTDIEAMGMIIITTEEEYNAIDWDGYEEAGYVVDGTFGYQLDLENGEMPPAYSNITSLDLSEAIYLEIIEEHSFSDPTIINYEDGNLMELILPKNGMLTIIEDYAFQGNKLTEVTIPATVTNIGQRAFEYNDLKLLVFEDTEENPSQIKIIGEDKEVFAYNELTKVVIPRSVEYIRSDAFMSNSITEVIIKNTEGNVTIEDGVFPSTATITYNPNYTE